MCCLASYARGLAMSPPDGAGEIRRIIDMAEDVKPEPPRPLMRELPPADPFPVDALGTILAGAARAIQDRVQAPVAIGAQSVVGAATIAVQGHADIVLPIGPGQVRPLSSYLITVALTGERKSASDTEAMWPIRQRELVLREQYETDALEYANDKAAYDAARAAAIKKSKGNRAEIRAALEAIGPAPLPPLTPLLTCEEPTYEGMCRLLMRTPQHRHLRPRGRAIHRRARHVGRGAAAHRGRAVVRMGRRAD